MAKASPGFTPLTGCQWRISVAVLRSSPSSRLYDGRQSFIGSEKCLYSKFTQWGDFQTIGNISYCSIQPPSYYHIFGFSATLLNKSPTLDVRLSMNLRLVNSTEHTIWSQSHIHGRRNWEFERISQMRRLRAPAATMGASRPVVPWHHFLRRRTPCCSPWSSEKSLSAEGAKWVRTEWLVCVSVAAVGGFSHILSLTGNKNTPRAAEIKLLCCLKDVYAANDDRLVWQILTLWFIDEMQHEKF